MIFDETFKFKFKKRVLATFPVSIFYRTYLKVQSKNPEVIKKANTLNDFYYAQLGVDKKMCLEKCKEISLKAKLTPQISSVHRMLFTALQLSGFRPKNILELGTNRGQTTAFLSELFPESLIHTVELPMNDPLVYPNGPFMPPQFVGELKENISRPNIRSLRLNTAFIFNENLPPLDLIWLDAGHDFPEVAWDHFYSLSHLNKGGWLFSDDVYRPENTVPLVIDYYNQRMPDKFQLILKREDPYEYVRRPKFIACYHKKGDDIPTSYSKN